MSHRRWVEIDKRKSYLKTEHNLYTDEKLQELYQKRDDTINDIFHKITTGLIEYAQGINVKTIVIGYNVGWKKGVKMGKIQNRNFCEIPFRRLIKMIMYKGKDVGIKVIEIGEGYTSKSDALSSEKICFHDKYQGKRIKRGLFKSGTGIIINADVNGQINIMRKYLERMKEGEAEKYMARIWKNIEKVKRPKKIRTLHLNKLTAELQREYQPYEKTDKLYRDILKIYYKNQEKAC